MGQPNAAKRQSSRPPPDAPKKLGRPAAPRTRGGLLWDIRSLDRLISALRVDTRFARSYVSEAVSHAQKLKEKLEEIVQDVE